MATIKLKKPARADAAPDRTPDRAPVRGAGAGVRKPRPTLAQAEALRAEREARYQEQLRQRFGDRPPAGFTRRDEGTGPGPRGGDRGDRGAPPRRDDRPGARRDAPGLARRDDRFDARGPAGRDDRGGPRGPAPRDDRGGPRGPAPRDDRRDDRPPAHGGERPAANRAFGDRPAADRDPRNAVARPERSGGPREDHRRGPHGGDPRGPRDAPDDRGFRGDDRRPPARRDDAPRPATRGARTAPPAPHGPRPGGRNTAFGGPPPAPAGRSGPRGGARHRGDDDDEDDDGPSHPEVPGSLRLSKRMSELGIASRREADEWIPKGWVRVDDHVVTELGSRVTPDQRITIDAKARHVQAQRVTVLIHKPVGYVSGQAEDGYEPAYVLVTPENQWHEDHSGIRFLRTHLRSLAPAGRLDIDSTGLLVLTQDGRVAKQLIGDDSEVEKEYLVRVKPRSGSPLSDDALALLRHGIELDGVALRPAQVEWVNDDQLRFVLQEGRKRQIRRMCEAVDLEVLGLKRVRIGRVMLGDLPPGQWRYLRLDEGF